MRAGNDSLIFLSYRFGRSESYTELRTSNGNLHVSARTVEVLPARIQEEWARRIDGGEISLRLGVESCHTDGDSIKMNQGDAGIRLESLGDDDVLGGYLGASFNRQINKRLNLLADLEYGRMAGDEWRTSLQLTLKYRL